MPQYDEKRKEKHSSTPKRPPRTPHGRIRDDGRSNLSGKTPASLIKTEAGRDASAIKLHTDAAADQKARRLRALAVTEGQKIFFADNAHQPDTTEGRRLLGHELAHGLQQSADGGSPASRSALEQEADAAGDRLAQGETTTVRLRATPGSRLLKEEKRNAPSISQHREEIGPVPSSGTISGPGFAVKYQYATAKGAKSARLSLSVPEGVGVTTAPLGNLEPAELKVSDAGGVKARTIIISVGAAAKGALRLRATFTLGSASFMVVFHLPTTAKA